jgi:hypothetical protein
VQKRIGGEVSDKKYPFSTGSQYANWAVHNCHECKKFKQNDIENSCDIDQALLKAEFDDGSVSEEIYKRMGAKALNYSWICPEKERRNENNNSKLDNRKAEV